MNVVCEGEQDLLVSMLRHKSLYRRKFARKFFSWIFFHFFIFLKMILTVKSNTCIEGKNIWNLMIKILVDLLHQKCVWVNVICMWLCVNACVRACVCVCLFVYVFISVFPCVNTIKHETHIYNKLPLWSRSIVAAPHQKNNTWNYHLTVWEISSAYTSSKRNIPNPIELTEARS